ncbi:MAG: helix-turn-helix domain-containing protein [Propionibacteriaceae bacterium]|nr:helix-turn-helix domain-containing protein [Propionibacteriaceae bacterium]
MNKSRTSDWADTVWSFVERAACQGASVQLTMTQQQYSPTEVAQMCDVSRSTLNRRIQDGTIRAVRHGGRWRITEAEVERYRGFLMAQAASAMADDF